MTESPSRTCTRFTHELDYAAIPTEAREQAKRCLLDWLGCAIQGFVRRQSAPIKKHTESMGGCRQASLIGGSPSSVEMAALYHGYLGHILEMDDVDRESISHPATVVIPAALSVGEWKGRSGKDVLAGIVAGYEVMLRVGAAVTPAHYAIWHTTGTAGAFGSAMAAGKVLALNLDQLDWALGNAGTMAAGLWQFLPDGGMSKFLHAGRGAANGVTAACLAAEGFTGATRILEGEQGFFAGYARQNVDYSLFEDFGKRWRSSSVSIKPYPCCRHTHSAIDSSARIREQATGRELARVTVRTYSAALDVAGIEDPQTPQEAKFSLRFCVARALLHGLLTERDFTKQTLWDPATRQLMKQLDLVVDPQLSAMMPAKWPSHIEAIIVDGSRLEARTESPAGDPDNPVLWPGIREKFALMTEGILDREGQEAVADLCQDFEGTLDAGDLIRLVNRLSLFPDS